MSRTELNELCVAFLKQYPTVADCADPVRAKKQCIQVSDDFMQFLRMQGGTISNTRYVRLFGLPEFCPEYYSDQTEGVEHAIVYAFGFFVDWTLRQYIETAEFPTIYENIGLLLEDWAKVELITHLHYEVGLVEVGKIGAAY